MAECKKTADKASQTDLVLLESEETDTEDEPVLTEEEYKESIKWKFGEKKDVSTKKKKTKLEIIKRIYTGFFVLACYINSYLLSTFTMALTPFIMMLIVQSELLSLNRIEKKDRRCGIYKREWAIQFAGHLTWVPKTFLN